MPAERFPAIELVPKKETQLLDFLSSNEESDGRGIVIAVLDQGKMVHLRLFSERFMLHKLCEILIYQKCKKFKFWSGLIKSAGTPMDTYTICDSVAIKKKKTVIL